MAMIPELQALAQANHLTISEEEAPNGSLLITLSPAEGLGGPVVDVLADNEFRDFKVLLGRFVFDNITRIEAVSMLDSLFKKRAVLSIRKFPWRSLKLQIPIIGGQVIEANASYPSDIAPLSDWEDQLFRS